MGTMTLLALTYTRDAATGPMLMGGRAEAARPGGGSGMILPPQFVNLIVKPYCCDAAGRLRRMLRRGLASFAAEAFVCIQSFIIHQNINHKKKQNEYEKNKTLFNPCPPADGSDGRVGAEARNVQNHSG